MATSWPSNADAPDGRRHALARVLAGRTPRSTLLCVPMSQTPLPASTSQLITVLQPKACGHARHVGTCAACQRTQLARWEAQLAEVSLRNARAKRGDGLRASLSA